MFLVEEFEQNQIKTKSSKIEYISRDTNGNVVIFTRG